MFVVGFYDFSLQISHLVIKYFFYFSFLFFLFSTEFLIHVNFMLQYIRVCMMQLVILYVRKVRNKNTLYARVSPSRLCTLYDDEPAKKIPLPTSILARFSLRTSESSILARLPLRISILVRLPLHTFILGGRSQLTLRIDLIDYVP